MAFFPKEEHVRREGVAMKIKHPHVKVGTHRDVFVTQAAQHFTDGEFVLNRVMDGSPPPLSKVRTFDRSANDNGNVISPIPLIPPPHQPKVHASLEEDELRKIRPDDVERERASVQDRYAHSHGFYQNFSPQPTERLHKVAKEHKNHGLPEIYGFKGLGQGCTDPVVSKAHVAPTDYNPLKMNRSPFHPGPDRPRGIMRVDHPNKDTIQNSFHYDDGVKLEDMMKREVRHPHLHQFPVSEHSRNSGAGEQWIQGMGMSDSPPKPRGRRSLHTNLSHDPFDNSKQLARVDSSFREHFPNYAMLPPPEGGYFHVNQAHTGVISPVRAATSMR